MIGVNLAGFFRRSPSTPIRADARARAAATSSTSRRAWSTTPTSNVTAALASLTKGGLNAVTKSLAIEYATRGIRFQRGRASASSRRRCTPAETHATLAGLHPLGRMGEVSDVVDAVVFLENAPFVTGEILHVDGGQSAGH